jgi:hypothetical protein
MRTTMAGRIASAVIACAVAATTVASAQHKDEDRNPTKHRVTALFLSRSSERVAAVAYRPRDRHVRLIDRKTEKQVVVATPVEWGDDGGFLCDDRFVLLSGSDGGGRIASAVHRMEDGADLCRPAEGLRDAAAHFPEIAELPAVPSTDGTSLCTLAKDGAIEIRTAATCEVVKRVRLEGGARSILAFVSGEDLLVKTPPAVVARVRVADGKVVWRARLWQVPPPLPGEAFDPSNKERAVGSIRSARVVRDAERVVFDVSTAFDDAAHPAWRALVTLDWRTGAESWRLECDALDRVFVAQRQLVVGLVDFMGDLTVHDARTGEFVGEAPGSVEFVTSVADADASDSTCVGASAGEIRPVALSEFDRRPAAPAAPRANPEGAAREPK